MNFRKSSKRLLIPPSLFSESYISDFATKQCKIATKFCIFIMAGLLCIIWSYFPWDACSTTVQRGNWLKTYPKKTLCIILLLKKPCLKVQVLQYEFVDWKWPPSPLELFQKIICFGMAKLPLVFEAASQLYGADFKLQSIYLFYLNSNVFFKSFLAYKWKIACFTM